MDKPKRLTIEDIYLIHRFLNDPTEACFQHFRLLALFNFQFQFYRLFDQIQLQPVYF